MEVMICVPAGTDISVIQREYPDLYEDKGRGGRQRYFVGRSMEEVEDDGDEELGEWMTYDECVEFCGFAEGAIPSSETLIEGNGGWAQGLISQQDFSNYAVDEKTKARWKARSDIWHKAYRRGQKLKGTMRLAGPVGRLP